MTSDLWGARRVAIRSYNPDTHARLLTELRERRPAPRELEVLALVAKGLTNPEIAGHLGMSTKTVARRIYEVKMTLQASTRVGAVAIAIGRGLLPSVFEDPNKETPDTNELIHAQVRARIRAC